MTEPTRNRIAVYALLVLALGLLCGIVYQRGVVEQQRSLIRQLWYDRQHHGKVVIGEV